MLSTPLIIVAILRFGQPRNAPSDTLDSVDGTVAVSSPSQYANAELPKEVRPSGNVTSVKTLQFRNASVPISDKLSGKETDGSNESWNAA